MNTKNFLKVLPFVLGLGLLISCGEKKQETTQKGEENTVVKVKIASATTQVVDETATYTASIQAEVINHITPTMPGRIQKIYVEIGDRVSKGQVLVQMDPSNLDQQTTQLLNLQRDYKRYDELLKVGGIAQQQVDQIKTQIEVLETAIKNLKENTVLRSPINGVVTARNYDDGNVFAQLPILTVQQLNPLKAIVNVSETYFPVLKKGMPVDVEADIYKGEHFDGKITLVYPTIDAVSHTVGVEVAINNRDGKLAPGMYSNVTMNYGSAEQVVIPDIAVVKQAGSNDRYVFIAEDGKVRYSKVLLGQRIGENVVILSGVSNGDMVVTAGQTRLIDGSQVEVVNE